MSVKTIGIVAGLGQLPTLGARAARERGWDAVVVSVAGGSRPELAAEAVSFRRVHVRRVRPDSGRLHCSRRARRVRAGQAAQIGRRPRSVLTTPPGGCWPRWPSGAIDADH